MNRDRRIDGLEKALRDVREAIIDKAPDTLWLSLTETAVERIDYVLHQAEPEDL